MVDRKKPAHGFSDWAWQRATAITMVIYSLLLTVRFVVDAPNAGFEGWHAWFAPLSFMGLDLSRMAWRERDFNGLRSQHRHSR
jgi:succinate dehydrogenase hydrophobic anchor subunit